MADIYQLPVGAVFDPTFDMSIGPMPVWLLIIVFLLIGIILVNFWWFFHYLIMAPVKGSGTAAKSTGIKTQQAFMFGKNRSFSIQALEYIDGILSYKDPNIISKWRLTAPTSVGNIGFKTVMIASDSYDAIRDPVAEIAICRIAREINANNPTFQIKNYTDLINILPTIENAYPDGIPIPPYFLYDPAEIQKYTPKDATASMMGGNLIRRAHEVNMHVAEKSLLEKYIPLILIASIGILGLVLTFMYVTGSKGAA